MSSDERFGSLAKVGKKVHRGDQKRRGTPIPVAPPRVPTPMPAKTDVHKSLQTTRKTPEVAALRNRGYEEEALPWINPRIIAKIDNDNLPVFISETVNDLHHSSQLTDPPGKSKEKQKPEQNRPLPESRRRMRQSKWIPNEGKSREKHKTKEETLNVSVSSGQTGKTSEKNLNQFTGEKDAVVSLTCTAVESGRVTPTASRSSDRFAAKLTNNNNSGGSNSSNNNNNNNNNGRCNYKYYGFLDSRDENVNGIESNRSTGTANSRDDKVVVGPVKMDGVNEHARNRKPARETGKEIVYENVKMESAKMDRKVTGRFDSGRTLFGKARGDERKSNYERRYLEYNVRVGKYEGKLNGFPATDLYGTCTELEDYKGGLYDGFSYLESKYTYSVSGVPGNLAQSSAAAAFFARASQKLNLSSPHRRKRHASSDDDPVKSTGFRGAIHRTPPPMPPALLRRIGVKEVTGVGKVKVMLKVTGVPSAMPSGSQSFFNVDSRKKQVTLYDPAVCGTPTAPEDRRVGVAAPKMFAFDAIFTQDDSQAEICSTALTDVIHAVINGTDGCLFCFGHAKLGKTTTMLGTPESANTLGIIPCAISWLFRGIHEQKQKTGARFSVRVSAVEVCQPTQQLKDLLAGHANDCEQSPGVYLRDDPLFGTQLQNQSELRVPNAEKAAFYLDAAVNSRSSRDEGRDSHFLYTLHVYQYSVAGKGGVAGGRSRLHLIDLGSSERGKSSGGIPLSGLGNVLLAIFNGQKHLPYREHKITQLLKECLSSLTCHAAMIAHVSQSSQNYTDTLTTVQLASRIHRMRRRKIKFGGPGGPSVLSNGGSSDELSRQNTSTGSSDFDLSSSEQSADTVIYVAPHDDAATDGEHPPAYMLNLNSVDNRCVLNKAARGLVPGNKGKAASPAKSVTSHKTKEEKSVGSPLHKNNKSGVSSSKSSPVRTAPAKVPTKPNLENHGKTVSSNAVQASRHEEHWIDGPRVSKQKVAEARNLLLKESSKKETWIDGPMQKPPKTTSNNQSSGNYGFMDSHKKTMIRKWVENQTVHLKQTLGTQVRTDVTNALLRSSEPIKDDALTCEPCVEFEELGERRVEGSEERIEGEIRVPAVTVGTALIKQTDACLKEMKKAELEGAVANSAESSGSSEEEKLPPPPLPLILRYGKDINIGNQNQPINALGIQGGVIVDYDEDEDEIELEIVEVTDMDEPVPMQDSCLQVTEEDIAFCMGECENPLPEVDQESHEEHPLRILSQENLTVVSTFTDSLSVATDFERCLPRPRYAPPSLFDQPFYPNGPYVYDEYIELLTKNHKSETNTLSQLAQLHEMYKSKIGIPKGGGSYKAGATTTTRCQSLSMTDVCENPGTEEVVSGNCSIYSEPAYKLPGDVTSACGNSKKTATKVAENPEKGSRQQKLSERVPSTCKTNLSSLRHPDGASNPNLDGGDAKKERISGSGTSKSDYEEENKEKSSSKKKMSSSEHKRGNSGSPNRKPSSKTNNNNNNNNGSSSNNNHSHNNNSKHEGTLTNDKSNESSAKTAADLLKLNETNAKLPNSPTRNSNSSSSRGELRRTNSTSTNKGRRIEESEEVPKSGTPPTPASSSSPPPPPPSLTQKHLYFNKTCPSNEGSDSGHESNVSPKITKLSGRTRQGQAQCESSGYESVVSFTSSLDSEVGVKLVCDETEEIHDPGGQSGWWCWCVSSSSSGGGGGSNRSSRVQDSMRQSQRRTSTGRTPLTVPPTSARPKT